MKLAPSLAHQAAMLAANDLVDHAADKVDEHLAITRRVESLRAAQEGDQGSSGFSEAERISKNSSRAIGKAQAYLSQSHALLEFAEVADHAAFAGDTEIAVPEDLADFVGLFLEEALQET